MRMTLVLKENQVLRINHIPTVLYGRTEKGGLVIGPLPLPENPVTRKL